LSELGVIMPPMSTLRMSEVTYDARDAGKLARFWAEALGWDVGPGASEYVADVSGPRRPPESLPMLFVQVPEEKAGKNRVHLDLVADDIAVEVARLVSIGATVVHEKSEWGHSWVTLQDPEGNEFCVASAVESAAAPDGG
jgi:predicted enzyme related to lactoylglutathione lyase